MFWALEEKSRPFRDFTYNPELFYRYPTEKTGFLHSIDFGILGHNSNGKGGPDSRSLDKHYLRFNFDREGDRWVTRFGAQVSYLYDFDETNRDIQEFIGPLSLSISFIQLFDSWVDKSEVALTASPGGKFATRWDHGGYQLSWSFRFGKFDLVPAFYLQYYYGYAETLLNYDQQVSEFRGGIVF
jgi:phospholipase A1